MAIGVEAGIEPLIATGRESHHLPWQGSQGQGVALLGALSTCAPLYRST